MFQSIVSNITVHISYIRRRICFGPSWSWSYGSWITTTCAISAYHYKVV